MLAGPDLLQPHRRLITVHAAQILAGLHLVAETVGAKQVYIGVKKTYSKAIAAIQGEIGKYPEMKIHYLQEVYPMGDEVVLIYECTGRVVRPGGLPADFCSAAGPYPGRASAVRSPSSSAGSAAIPKTPAASSSPGAA